MYRLSFFLLSGLVALADEPPIVFRSDVALVRVDVQVVDRNNRAITGLHVEDFALFQGGQKRDIRNFEAEDMPMDLLFLLDVSGSMQSHVQRIAEASDQALRVLGPDDRVAIMVFDRATRVRMPFRKNGDSVVRELENVLNQESFDGGTDITRGLFDASSYMEKQGRRNARRAIVILTDDETERGKDEEGVLRALTHSDSVLSALIAPDAMRGRYGQGGGSGGGGGGGWPRNGGGMGGPLGGIILGRRGPYGSGYPGGGGGGGNGPVVLGRGRTSSAGTEEIARRSGGDSMRVDDSAALEQTLTRLRQRYTLHFNLADGGPAGDAGGLNPGDLDVQLSAAAKRRYPGSEVRFRRSNAAQDGAQSPDPVMVSRTPSNPPRASSSDEEETSPRLRRRRPAVNDDGTRIDAGPLPAAPTSQSQSSGASGGGWRRADESDRAAAPEASPAAPPAPKAKAVPEDAPQEPAGGGWRRIKPGEQP